MNKNVNASSLNGKLKMFDFTRFNATTEEQFLNWFFAQSYKVSNTAVTIRERQITPATIVENTELALDAVPVKPTKDHVILTLDIRLGSSPTKGTETYSRIDLGQMFAGVDEIKVGAAGLPTLVEFREFFKTQYLMPTDGLDITDIGNAYTVKARPDSLLFVGKKTLYIR